MHDKCLKNEKVIRHISLTMRQIYKKKIRNVQNFKEQVKVYIFVARWLDGLVVKFSILKNEKGIYFSGLAAWWLFSRVT